MTWILGLARGAWEILRAVPWKLWLAAALLVAAWWWGERRHDEGVAEERLAWSEAQRKADLEVAVDRAVRFAFAQAINSNTATAAQAAQQQTRDETLAALQRVEDALADFSIPAGCPTGLPGRVRAEGRAAVDRARSAGDQMRAGGNAAAGSVAR